MVKKTVLLLNVGTPDHCDHHSVKRYLREFLTDPRVIDLPWWVRLPLVNLFIVPFRYRTSTKAYQQIWSDSGSPLLMYCEKITHALAQTLGSDYEVALGMRYGNPSIASVLDNGNLIDSLMILPLFPQYSSAATGSCVEKVFEVLEKKWNMPALFIQKEFYAHPNFIKAYADLIKAHLNPSVEIVVFSYHGLPEHHIEKSKCIGCDKQSSCPKITENNLYCYRAQCYDTSRLIAEQLGYAEDQYRVSFQSRLGSKPWIKPYTDLLLPQLAKQGIKRIAMVSPSFVADCLETLEEVNIRTRAQWCALGGEEFLFIPCLNDHPLFIDALAEIVRSHF